MNDLDILRDIALIKVFYFKTNIMKFIEEAKQGSEIYKEFILRY